MISKTIGFRGTQHFQTHPYQQTLTYIICWQIIASIFFVLYPWFTSKMYHYIIWLRVKSPAQPLVHLKIFGILDVRHAHPPKKYGVDSEVKILGFASTAEKAREWKKKVSPTSWTARMADFWLMFFCFLLRRNFGFTWIQMDPGWSFFEWESASRWFDFRVFDDVPRHSLIVLDLLDFLSDVQVHLGISWIWICIVGDDSFTTTPQSFFIKHDKTNPEFWTLADSGELCSYFTGIGKCPMTWGYWTSPEIVAI